MRQQRQLQIQRHELQHFVDVMQGYITNQLFYLSWRELEDDLATKVGSYPSPSSPLMIPLSVRFTVWMTSSLPTKPLSIKLYFGESYLCHNYHSLTACIHHFPYSCLLSKKAAAVMSIIRTIFSSILRFCSTLTSSVHPSPHHHYHTMCHTHRKFRETAGLLMKGRPHNLSEGGSTCVCASLFPHYSHQQAGSERLSASPRRFPAATEL